jgi:carboxymethylenebutenolidase
MGETVTLTAADGHSFSAYQASPAGAPNGAVVVIQEIFGVNIHIREVVDGYAADGYFAIAPALFDRVEAGVELGYEDEDMAAGMGYAFEKLQQEDALKDIQAAIDAASAQGKVGVVGYCFGGLMTWMSACTLNGVSAASSYYGGGLVNVADLTPQCPVIMHFGELDAFIPMDDVEKIKAANEGTPVYTYNADHGFNCNHRGSYDADAAATAKERTLAFFAENLA